MSVLTKIFDLYEAVLTDLPGVICIIDTDKPQSGDKHALGHAAVLKGDKIVGWHVTDSAKAIRQIVRKGGSLMRGYGARGQTAELGPGLYVSAVPHTWVNRSRGKWDFLKDISKTDLKKLVDVLKQKIDKSRQDEFISQNEYDYAARDLKNVKAGSCDADVLIGLAGQPVNIRFWKESFLKPLGIATAKQPIEVEIHLKGKFAGIEGSHAPPKTLRMLRRGGVDGAFIKGGFSGDAQLVVWNPKAVVKIRKEQKMEEKRSSKMSESKSRVNTVQEIADEVLGREMVEDELDEEKKFKVGDKVRVASKGLQWHSRQTPAHMGYTREQMSYRHKLSAFCKKKTVGVVDRVFPSGELNVKFKGALFGIKPQMVELVSSK